MTLEEIAIRCQAGKVIPLVGAGISYPAPTGIPFVDPLRRHFVQQIDSAVRLQYQYEITRDWRIPQARWILELLSSDTLLKMRDIFAPFLTRDRHDYPP